MARILVLLAHPALEKSRVHRRLLSQFPELPGLTLHDLYEVYPTLAIDVPREQRLLLDHDLIMLQHPFYWYSTPPIMKQWMDLVLEHGWAYGSQGGALRGRQWLNLLSTGGAATAYQRDGYNRFSIRELLTPMEQTANLCRMEFLAPYVIHGTHRLTNEQIEAEAMRYRQLLTLLQADQIDLSGANQLAYLNPLLDRALQGEGETQA